jgi:AcrR family transcriptional regulator
MARNDALDLTRERILNNAEALFAQKGFRAVSIREITKAAQCNLAAVNYHFGNKKNLYLEVFLSRWVPRARKVRANFRKTLASSAPLTPDAVVRSLAQAFLEGPLTDEERFRHSQLMTRELAQPSAAFDQVAEKVMRPFFKELTDLLQPFLIDESEEERLLLNIFSIFGMVLYFNFARVAVSRITGRQYDADFKARLVEQITQFSLTGMGVK